MTPYPRSIRAVLFDFDGTLTRPGTIDFARIKTAIGCPPARPILEFIAELPSDDQRQQARATLERIEMEAAAASLPNEGCEDLVHYLKSRRLKLGIISRNSYACISRAFENFSRIGASDFEVLVTRDDCPLPKPHPDPILQAAATLEVDVKQVFVVGDFIYDIEAGHRAEARTVFLTNREPLQRLETSPDFTIDNLARLRDIVDRHLPLRAGKLPNHLLGSFLEELTREDPNLLIAPGIGQDVAAVALDGEEVLVLKTDPVTFATDALSDYSVVVNINDLATSGAKPRWLLSALLFPIGTCAAHVRQVMSEIFHVARKYGLIPCGGHTEITDAVNRTVVVVQMAGTVSRDRLQGKRTVRQGDCVLLTKGAAIEGTSLIAREFCDRLEALGMPCEDIERSRNYLTDPGISIVKEAAIAAESEWVSAMHDVTEGGVATAIEELSLAGGHKIRIFSERIPIMRESATICRLLGLDPLGLIGSGGLLIVCAPTACEELQVRMRRAGIAVRCIGEVMEPGTGVEACDENRHPTTWPRFEVDEITRLYADEPTGSG